VPALTAFIMRNWQAALGAAAVAVLATLLAIRTGQRDDARSALERERLEHNLFAERVRAKAEEIRARFIEHARRVERNQNRVSQEVSREYQARLIALRADYERRLRPRPGQGAGGAGGPALPGLPGAPGGPDGAAPAARFEFACRANSLQLEYLQAWLRQQMEVDRDPVPLALERGRP
jgi:uncharacterized protein YfcZ (UPF0381/DUF406 family)